MDKESKTPEKPKKRFSGKSDEPKAQRSDMPVKNTAGRNSQTRKVTTADTLAKKRSTRKKRNLKKSLRRQKRRFERNKQAYILRAVVAVAAIVLLILFFNLVRFTVGKISSSIKASKAAAQAALTVTPTPTEAPKEVTYTEEEIDFTPQAVDSTQPSNMMDYTEINVDGTTLSSISDYSPAAEISFGVGTDYTDVEGIIGFRGNNFRNNPTYGFANLTDHKFATLWTNTTGALSYGSETWTGNGWTGQPLIVKWPASTKAHMNMYDWAKEDDDLVEVIYASMDGYVYFMDLETGEKTRDDLYLGFTFKGAGALDPRGYPILYVGAGYNSDQGNARVFIINLLDCSTMYTFGNDDDFNLRGNLSFFDGSALVDADTDTLIYPGESGILYLMKLNTDYDEEAGTLSINPSNIVKWHYWGLRSSSDSFWLGMEDSAAIYKGYMFIADNGGHLMCLNLNTLELVWVQDVLDDTNDTPVLSIEDGHLYLYISTSFRLGWRSYDTATIPIWKIDAQTGEIIWQVDYTCETEDGVSGGVQSTIASGRFDFSDYIYVTVSKTGGTYAGVLACIDKNSGEVKWEHEASYAWSSPDCVYNSDGSGVVVYCDSSGTLYMLDGLTGSVYDQISLSDGVIEASPAVYNNILVVGTRDCQIYGIEMS